MNGYCRHIRSSSLNITNIEHTTPFSISHFGNPERNFVFRGPKRRSRLCPPNVEGRIRTEIDGDNSDGDNDGEYDDNDDDDGIKIRRVSHIRTVTHACYDS